MPSNFPFSFANLIAVILILGVTAPMAQAQQNEGLIIDLQFNGNLKSSVGTTEGLTLQPPVFAKGIDKKAWICQLQQLSGMESALENHAN